MQKGSWLVGLLFWGVFAVGFSLQESQSLPLPATTRAVGLAADGPATGAYQYRYSVADRVCRGQTKPSEKPIAAPGTESQVHYDPRDVCQSVTYDPVINLVGVVIGLAWVSALLAFIAWNYWPPKGPE